MGHLPWESDRYIDVDTARSVIRAEFPDVDVTRVDRVGSGWEFDVFVTADRWAFRFPRRVEYESLFEREAPVLALVRSSLQSLAAVPVVELRGSPSPEFPYRFAGHRFIEGVAADAVDPLLHAEMARGLGAALGAIHSIPIDAARAAGVHEYMLNEGTYEWFRRNLSGASQLIDSDRAVHDAVAWVSQLDDPLRSREAPLRFTHNDLAPDHTIVDPSTGRLAGLVDWTCTTLGDAARDFVTFAAFGGWGLVEQVLANYSGTVDSDFRERLRFMARFLSVMWLGEAQQNGGDVRKHITWVENAFDA